MRRIIVCLAACLVWSSWLRPVPGYAAAGTVVAVQGGLDIQRGKEWIPLASGDEVTRGAHLRTASGARAKLLLEDDSVLDLGAGSELSIETFDAQPGKRQVVLRLGRGKVHAWVGERYKASKARFEIETPTAVASVRGTEFLILYSPETELTEVVGITDAVQVFGKLGVVSGSVEVGPNGYTQVQKGRFPIPVQQVDALRVRQFLEGLELRGTGRRDGMNVEHPVVMGHLLSKDDVPAIAVANQEPATQEQSGPRPPAAFSYSMDVYTNRQPLRQYQFSPPGKVGAGTGGVVVDF